MTKMLMPVVDESRVNADIIRAQVGFSRWNERYPSLSWGFLLFAVRWHMHRMTQAEMAALLHVDQKKISRWELYQLPVPDTVRSWLVQVILTRLKDGKELPRVVGLPQPSRNQRQRDQMLQHGTFGGKGGKRKKKAA